MNKKTALLQVIVFAILVSINFTCGDRKVIARVGNHLIRLQEFKTSFMADKAISQIKKAPLDRRVEHLNKMIENELKLLNAYSNRLDKDSLVLDHLKAFEKEKVYRYVIDKQIIEKIISKKMLQLRYDEKGTEIKASQIFLPLESGANDSTKEKIRDSLESIRNRFLKGESFEELARNFSRDSLSAGKGGDIGFIKFDDAKFGHGIFEQAFALKIGQITPIIESKDGFHLLLVEKKREIEQEPYKNQEVLLKRSFFRDKRNDLQSTFKEFAEKVKKSYSIRYHDENISYLFGLAQSNNDLNSQRRQRSLQFNSPLTDEDKQKSLVDYDDQKYTMDDFVRSVQKISSWRRPYFENTEQIKNYVDDKITVQMITKWAYHRGYQNNSGIIQEVDKQKEKLMLRQLEDMIILKAEPTEEQLKKYFEDNKNKLVNPPTSKVQEIFIADYNLAVEINKRAKNGENFDKLAEKYNERRPTQRQKGILGYIAKDMYGEVGKVADKMKTGQISNLINSSQGYSTIKILDKMPQTYQTFEEAADRVKRNVQIKNRAAIEKEWMNDLRKRFSVQIYKNTIINAYKTDEFQG